MKLSKEQLEYAGLALALCLLSFLIKDLKIIGIIIIVENIYFCFAARKNKMVFILAFLFAFINCSVAYYDLILGSVNSPLWQRSGLFSTEYNIQTARSILMTSAIFPAIVIPEIPLFKGDIASVERKDNSLISFGLAVVLSIIVLFAYFTEFRGREAGYSSVTNTVFEYSSILIVLLWYYSKKREKLCFWFTNIYAFLYLIIFLRIGDRSSVAIVLVTVFIINFLNRFSLSRIIPVTLLVIFTFNMIGYSRSFGGLSLGSLAIYALGRGLYVDTISWSYYASVSISALHTLVPDSWRFIFGNLFYYITGITTEYSGMSTYGPEHFSALRNEGGGIYSSYFFGMGGYWGVVIGAIILGVLVCHFFKMGRNYHAIYSILMITLMFRWYLYSISTLFRGILVLTSIAIILCALFASLSQRRKQYWLSH